MIGLAGRARQYPRILLGLGAVAILGGCATSAPEPEREFVLAPPIAEDEEEAVFAQAAAAFTSAADCEAHLRMLVEALPSAGYPIAKGPYEFPPDETRAHGVRVADGRYQVLEYRCYGTEPQVRAWWAGPAQAEDRPFTLEEFFKGAE